MKRIPTQGKWENGETLVLSTLKRGGSVLCADAVRESGMPRPTFQWYLRKLKKKYTIWTVYLERGWCYVWQPNYR